jgi:hypothetical protein
MEWIVEQEWPEDSDADEPETVAKVKVPLSGTGWHADIVLRLVNAVVAVTEVRYSGEPDSILTGSVLKTLKLGAVAKAIAADLRSPMLKHALPSKWLDTSTALPRPGRAGRGLVETAVWVERYLDAVRDHPDRPVGHLIDTFGVSRSGINDTINRAEALGLIAGRPAGRQAGGRMTSKARRLLDAHRGGE